MGKLEVKFELTGLKFEVNGERDDVAGALASLQQQVSALAQSAAAVSGSINGQSVPPSMLLAAQSSGSGGNGAQPSSNAEPPIVNASQRTRSRRSGGGSKTKAEPIQFSHDPDKFGFPKQDWNTANKAMWLLYVLEMEANVKEATAHAITATFKLYFKEFGIPLPHNITRDLGAAKKKSLVNSDPTKNPESWYLLSAGKSGIQNLIQNPSATEGQEGE